MQTKAIKQKMKSVGNIKKITKTMEMISVTKMKKYVSLAKSSKEYAKEAFNLISHIASQTALSHHHFFKKRKNGKNLIIVITSDKGLCGAYNVNIYKKLAAFKKVNQGEIDIISIGKYAEKYAKILKLNLLASFIKITPQNSESEVRSLSNIFIEKFIKEDYRGAFILYTEFVKASKFRVRLREILPLNEEVIEGIILDEGTENVDYEKQKIKDGKRNLALCEFEPSQESILNAVVPLMINSIAYQLFLESTASEHSSRMLAMKAAFDNATDLYDSLLLSFNQARQDSITKELSEIVGGAGALQS